MKYIKKEFTRLTLRPHVIFAILALFFGTLSAFLVPQLSVNDETAHFLRSYSVASGEVRRDHCTYPTDVKDKVNHAFKGGFYTDYRTDIDFSKTVNAGCGSASSYSPIMHLPQIIGIVLSKIFDTSLGVMVLTARLCNLLFYVVAMYFIIKYTRLGKWVFTVVGLFPILIHSAASLSGDVTSTVAAFAAIAFTLSLFVQNTKISKKQILLLFALVCMTALTKPTNVLLFMPLVFLPARIFNKNSIASLPFNVQKWSIGLACGIISILCVIGWQKIAGSTLVSPVVDNPLEQNPFHFLMILFNTYISPSIGYNDILLRGTIGEFSSFRYHLPTFMLLVGFFLLLVVMLHKNTQEEQGVKRVATPLVLSTVLALFVQVVVITYVLYVSWAIQPSRLGPGAIYADGVQGRYFTAAFTLLIPLFIWLRRFIRVETKSENIIGIIVLSASTLMLAFYIMATYLYIT